MVDATHTQTKQEPKKGGFHLENCPKKGGNWRNLDLRGYDG